MIVDTYPQGKVAHQQQRFCPQSWQTGGAVFEPILRSSPCLAYINTGSVSLDGPLRGQLPLDPCPSHR